MDYDFILRACAVVAAAALLAGPRLVAVAKAVRLPAVAAKAVDPLADAHTILEIASRLKAVGNGKGVELCQAIIDTMLAGAKK